MEALREAALLVLRARGEPDPEGTIASLDEAALLALLTRG